MPDQPHGIESFAPLAPAPPPSGSKYDRLIARAKEIKPATTIVVHPCDETSLRGPVEAAEFGIIKPVLVGPAEKIKAVAHKHKIDISRYEIVDVAHSEAAAAKAVALIREGKGELLMKGSLHTDELMRNVTSGTTGLRTGRRISHVFVMDVPTYAETLFVTDAAINIFPDLDTKRDIVQNAIDLFTETGLGTPRVAILSAVETVTSKIPSTIEAAALCKMADRGQITGGLLDGPLAFDNAIDPEAAKIKGIRSEVAGRAQISRRARSRSWKHACQESDLFGQSGRRRNRAWRTRTHYSDVTCGFCASSHGFLRGGRHLCRCPPPQGSRASRVTAMDAILVVNAGSSSLKFQVFDIEAGNPKRLIKGQMDGIGTRPRLKATGADGVSIDKTFPPEQVCDLPTAIQETAAWLRSIQNFELKAVGHRVVHGGPEYSSPVFIDSEVVTRLERYIPLAPLHQPNNLAPIRSLLARNPKLPQVACFDTAFHRGHTAVVDHFAIPEKFYAEGVRRYGFHGLSYEYIAHRLHEVAPTIANKRVIVAHLGSGASMCALSSGRSIESTMGFTALDGLPMGTRPGQLDPGVVLYLMSEKGMDAAAIQNLFYHECGMKGLSGISNDMRDLETSAEPRAALALEYFVYRVGLSAGMLAAALGGLDAFVFTAGIGENSATIRARIAEKLAWLGADIDPALNTAGKQFISGPNSRVALCVVPTDEELMIARHTLALLAGRTKKH